MTNLPPTHNPESHTTPNPSSTRPPRRRARGLFGGTITPRTAAAPIAAFTMAVLLYTYSVTSINAAKRNAALHRAADGGQLDMRRESLRRHGALGKVEGTKGVELFRHARDRDVGESSGGSASASGDEGAKAAQVRRERSEVEGGLEGWKGKEGAERFKEGPPGSRILAEGKGR